MTTYAAARDDIVSMVNTALQTLHPTLPVFWENTLKVDLDTVTSPFVRIELDFDDAMQLTVNDDPEHRTYGTLYFTVFCKEGTGTRSTLVLFESFTNIVKFKHTATYVFGVPRPGRKDPRQGWVSQELAAPFWFDSL